MKNKIYLLIICLLSNIYVSGIDYPEVMTNGISDDGPYIFITDDGFKAKWIENGILRENIVTPENFAKFRSRFKLMFDYDDLKSTFMLQPDYGQKYTKVDSIGIITDVHGEYGIYLDLLNAMGIIDSNLKWKFGKGHLVVLGDVFDRGDMVTEILWHIFGLEKQAKQAGGMVHYLLGNHELMVLSQDLRYINDKYRNIESICDTTYNSLYSDSTVLGRWLLSKPVMTSIDDIIFVHGGISIEMVQKGLTIEKINRKFSEGIVGKDPESVYLDEELKFLNDDLGPMWYRGYFRDSSFCESTLDSILGFYGKKHIVVGHTANKGIRSFYNSKILGADAGIMYKQKGEMLIYKNKSFYIGLPSGKRIRLY